MEELSSETAVSEEPKVEDAGATSHGPVEIGRPVHRLTKLEKAVGVLRAILPIAHKCLPLLDGQIGTVVSNLIGPQTSPRQIVNALLPLQEGLAQLERRHMELRAQVSGQSAALSQIDEQLEEVKKLAGETAENQRNLTESLEKMGRKLNWVAIAGLVLLATVVTLNVVLLVHIRRILP